MSAVTVVFIILAVSIAVYFALSALFAVKAPSLVGSEEYPLQTNQMVMNSELLRRTWQGTENTASGATVLFFIWPTLKDRTTRTGNEYATAINIADSVKFKILTSASATRTSSAPAILEVMATGQAAPVELEIPDIPLQRWSAIAIVKQGRRFKVYVNNKLTAATMLDTMPQYNTSGSLMVGDSRLAGKIALLSLVDYPMSTEGVSDFVRGYSDSTFKPHLSSSSGLAIPSLKGFQISCPGGICGGTAPLANPLDKWTSPYG